MDPDVIAIDENRQLKTARDIEDCEEGNIACMVVGSSGYNSSTSTSTNVADNLVTSTTDRIAAVDTVTVAKPLKELSKSDNAHSHGLSIGKGAEEHSSAYVLNSVATTDGVEDGEKNVNTASDNRNESISTVVTGLQDSEMKGEVDTDSVVITSTAATDRRGGSLPAGNYETDSVPKATFEIADCDNERTVPTHETTHASTINKRPKFRSSICKINSEGLRKIKNHHHRNSSKPESNGQQCSSSLIVSSLPIDSLHSIASFLIPIEWKNFGQCNKAANKICKEIFRRVRMHGFRCATEVVTAWKFGQHADAKELCALYVSTGVPIYPHSLGHSYHTLLWRLSIEAKHMQEHQQETTKNGASSNSAQSGVSTPLNSRNTNDRPPLDPSAGITIVDPFFNARDDFRMREELIDGLSEVGLTYLEEKSLYNLNSKGKKSEIDMFTRSHWRRSSIDQAHRRARNLLPGDLARQPGLPQVPHLPPPLPPEATDPQLARDRWNSLARTGRSSLHRRELTRSNSFSGNRYRAPNVSLKIHRHLLDQHLLGRPVVNDFEGSMTTPPVSLSADFFHPFFSFRSSEESPRYQSRGRQDSSSDTTATSSLLPAYHQLPAAAMQQMDSDENIEIIREQPVAGRIESRSSTFVDDSDSDIDAEIVLSRPQLMEHPRLDNADEMMAAGATLQPPAMVPAISQVDTLDPNGQPRFSSAGVISEIPTISHGLSTHNDILSNIDLDVYSVSCRSLKSDNNDAMEHQLNKYLKARFKVYHCCLERHLLKNDNDSFNETIMDFWDEFFPQTANIQYYDKHTAVPRVSCLEKFLTKPCPKSIGIVQCEIERVKLSSKKKGVNMKGRFFPTYEYRLFIRHRSEQAYDLINAPGNKKRGRRDTVLMMAKNRGRKYPDNTGQASKKGSNNYYLSLPQQDDLDLHYKSVNGQDEPLETSPNGTGTQNDTSEFAGLLGRLQSNFVGTEFQIFTPRSTLTKTRSPFLAAKSLSIPRSVGRGVDSDDEISPEPGRQSELSSISSARPRSRFGRLSLKGRSANNSDTRTELSEPFLPKPSHLALRRSRSSDATPGRNRKVSAAESYFESQHFKTEKYRAYSEEEDGAITYTANLLGSRPRIMDVCIPKVNSIGTEMEWKRCLENYKEQDASYSADRLLNYLKQLQQNSQMDEQGRLVNPANNDGDAPGLDERYSSPGDSGLLALQNRPPWWNVELGSFVLNFGGRVSVASVKNFQLCDRNDQDHIMLQFGRIEGRHSFTMDFQYPLTAVQAFAIAISSLQSKISFG